MKHKLSLIVVVIVAVFTARHLLLPGYVPTHDGEYHIIRFWQFDKVFRGGNLLPRWAPDLDQGRGIPLFAFFYPLPNYIAEIFILLGFSYVNSLHLVLASGLIISGITFYLWMTTLFKPWASAVGAIFYVLAPYHLVDVFIRGSVGEVWALMLVPLVLFFTTKLIINRAQQPRTRTSSVRGGAGSLQNSITLFLLLVSHNILGPVFYLFSLLYGVIINLQTKKGRLWPLLQSYTIGFMLAAFFWLPVIFDRQYVEGLNFVDVTNHFPQLYQLLIPSWGTGFSGSGNLANQMSFQIGVPHLLVLLTSIILFVLKGRKNLLLAFFLLGTLGSLGLMLEAAKPIWSFLPFMQYFQYPWRLLSIVIIVTSWLAAYVIEHTGKTIAIGLTIFALLFYLPYTQPVVYKTRADSFYLTNPTWTQGTATLGDSFRVKQGMRKKIEDSAAKTVGEIVSILGFAWMIFVLRRIDEKRNSV